MFLIVCIFTILILYYTAENIINRRCLKSFQAVIHVNGIRGKTSTCRYLDSALRSRYRVFTKTTGTDAMMIDTLGHESPVRRLGPANLHEQLRVIRRAHKEKADILILECMAVNPELQKTAQEQIVRSNITVITNVRYDHIFEMGDTLEEIAASLSATIPENGVLYTTEPNADLYFSDICREKNCRLVLCPASGTETENVEIARAVSASLGVTETEFAESLPKVKRDFGARNIYPIKNKKGELFYFLNLFSANDPQSTKNNVEELRDQYTGLCFLYNHREDRPDRALLFARCFFPHYRNHRVFVTGHGASLPKRLFTGAGLADLSVIPDWKRALDLPAGTLLVGIGNIKGAGYQMITFLDERREKYE